MPRKCPLFTTMNQSHLKDETFYKYLGVEIAINCEFNIVKKERNIKARKAVFSIRQALATSGNVSVKLAMKLFDSKIEPILTYGSIIWGIENSNNTIIIDGLKEVEQETTKNQVAKVFRECFRDDLEPELGLIKRIGRKNKNIIRPVLVKFRHYEDKEKILFTNRVNDNSFSVRDNYSTSTFNEIQLTHDNFIKYSLNIPKNSSSLVSRNEVGKFPLSTKVWSQMVNTFYGYRKEQKIKLLTMPLTAQFQ